MDSAPAGEALRRAAAGDATAWEELVRRFTPLLWSVCRAHRLDDATAGDVVQTTWLRLVEHLGDLHDPDRVGAWLATTARRECLRALRRTGREQLSEPEDFDVLDERVADLDAGLLRDERAAAVWRCFGRLPERCQRLLRLLMADPPPSYEQVSAALDWPMGSLGPTRARCLAKLRDLLSDEGISAGTSGSAR